MQDLKTSISPHLAYEPSPVKSKAIDRNRLRADMSCRPDSERNNALWPSLTGASIRTMRRIQAESHCLILHGKTCRGKTRLAVAIACRAIQNVCQVCGSDAAGWAPFTTWNALLT